MKPGRMMHTPLTLTSFATRAEQFFSRTEVVTRRPDRSLARTTYGALVRRAARLAAALARLGVGRGDTVATLCWNHDRHLEAYLAVPAMGAVLHTLNLRLHPNEIGYIAAHGGAKVVLVDASLWPLFESFRGAAPALTTAIVVDEAGAALPAGALGYEAELAADSDAFTYPALDENEAAMLCYTSGTTGRPKGVLYSHRSSVLHALTVCTAAALGVGPTDTVLPVVPMFHATAWGLPYAAVAAGARLVLPGPHLDAASLLELIASERVTLPAGVPTLWLGMLNALDAAPGRYDVSSVRAMVVGGSAAPPSLIEGFETRHGVRLLHAWGMTETSPVGTVAHVKPSLGPLDEKARLAVRATQGYAVPLVEQRLVADDGALLPWDGTTLGELEVRGPWVASSYVDDEDPGRFTADGWFKTGDVVTVDPEGYVRIADRSKDVIKSGGEWVSSVALENALMSHPAVLEAAVFAASHPKWVERPVAAVTLKPGASASKDDLRAHLEGSFAKFWLPDEYIFVAQIPRTSTGKFLKTALRERYGAVLLGAPAGGEMGESC